MAFRRELRWFASIRYPAYFARVELDDELGSISWPNGFMLSEQVWDENPPAGRPGFPPGEGTFSATPLAWTHAQ